jgi:hypothetical protein
MNVPARYSLAGTPLKAPVPRDTLIDKTVIITSEPEQNTCGCIIIKA